MRSSSDKQTTRQPKQLELFPEADAGQVAMDYRMRNCPRCGFSLRSMRRSQSTGSRMLRMRNWLETRTVLQQHLALLHELDPRDYALIHDRFLLSAADDTVPALRIPSLRSLGEALGLSAARVHQRLARALGRLDQIILARQETTPDE